MINIHPKVKWATLAALVATALRAMAPLGGPTAPGWLGGLIAAVAALVGGYSRSSNPDPTVGVQDDQSPVAVDPKA